MPLLFSVLHAAVLAQTTTTSVPRVVGDPLPRWVVLAASFALLVVILTAGFIVRRRMR
jgi:hypothetical protein